MLRDPKNPWLLAGWALIVFGVLGWLDFPKPLVDDLAYCGAALNLAGGGDLSNPLLLRYQLPGHFFFLCPPLHSFALAGWLRLFGVSARAMTAFPAAMYFVAAASTMALLRRRSAPALILWLVPLGVSTSLLSAGLRPEPFAIALTMAGFALFECGPRGLLSRGLAFSLLFLGASVAPRMTVFSAALILFALDNLRGERGPGGFAAQWRLWAPPVAGLLVSVSAFLGLIQFRLGEFWRTFHFVGQTVTGGKIVRLINYLNENPFLNNAQFPLLLLLGALFVFAWPPRHSELKRLSLFLAAAFPVVALIGGLGAGSLWFIVLTLFLLASAVLDQRPDLGIKLKATLSLALLLANVEVPVTAHGLLRGKLDTSRGPELADALALRSTPGHTVLVDSSTARYVFGYRLPPDFLDLSFAAPFPNHFALDDTRPGDIYLAGPEVAQVLKDATLLDVPVPVWVPFGLPNRRFQAAPRRVYVIPAEACQRRRTK